MALGVSCWHSRGLSDLRRTIRKTRRTNPTSSRQKAMRAKSKEEGSGSGETRTAPNEPKFRLGAMRVFLRNEPNLVLKWSGVMTNKPKSRVANGSRRQLLALAGPSRPPAEDSRNATNEPNGQPADGGGRNVEGAGIRARRNSDRAERTQIPSGRRASFLRNEPNFVIKCGAYMSNAPIPRTRTAFRSRFFGIMRRRDEPIPASSRTTKQSSGKRKHLAA